MNLDAHHHFWRYNAEDYDWIDDSLVVLRRDFLPDDLRAVMEESGVEGAISVQARQSLQETDWLLELARTHRHIKGVVGWLPLMAANASDLVAQYAAYPVLRGVRHVVQGEADGFMDQLAFNRGIAVLKEFDLTYDLLIFERQLEETIRLVDRHPGQVFILDHAAKPRIKGQTLHPWDTNIRELARRDNVYCKVSGMVTEAEWGSWNASDLTPYWETVLDAFGPSRLMFGSDWPVCLVAAPYALWIHTVREWASALADTEQAQLFGETAATAYGILS